MLTGSGLLVLTLSMANPEGVPQAAPDPHHIYGGEQVGACGWPSVVSIGGGSCTAALVHPLIVLTAAHCVADGVPTEVRFGENVSTAVSLADAEYCRQGPGWTGATAQGEDYAYCKLSSPVTSVPIIPVAAGCEQTAIQPGARIVHVGFGRTETGGGGQKKMLDTTIDAVTSSGELISGDFDEIICNGDSGGPTFVYLDPAFGGDGSWRVAAIHSWAQGADPVDPNCFGQAGSVLVSQAIDWVEEDSGIDITPCTDGDTWAPTVYCGGLATEPWVGQGTYTDACTSPDEVAFSEICGPALAADAIPPTISILTPTQEEELASDGGSLSVAVELDAVDEGWGIATVELKVRGVGSGSEQVDTRSEWEPWTWQLTLPAGTNEVEAPAIDHAGNASEPMIVCFGVDELSCPEEEGTGSGGADSTGGLPVDGDTGDTSGGIVEDDDGSDTGTPEADGGGGEGCGCRSTEAPRGAAMLAFVVLALVRRRTS
jgi:MYXO-CTERM domain-containing protein